MSLREDEFGELSFQVDLEAVKWRPAVLATDTRSIVSLQSRRDPKLQSKLGLMCSLRRLGWRPDPSELPHLVLGAPQLHLPGLLGKSKWYALALLHCSSIFAKVNDQHQTQTLMLHPDV